MASYKFSAKSKESSILKKELESKGFVVEKYHDNRRIFGEKHILAVEGDNLGALLYRHDAFLCDVPVSKQGSEKDKALLDIINREYKISQKKRNIFFLCYCRYWNVGRTDFSRIYLQFTSCSIPRLFQGNNLTPLCNNFCLHNFFVFHLPQNSWKKTTI